MTFSRRVPPPGEPNALTSRLAARRERGDIVLDLTESNPARAGLGEGDDRIQAALRQPGIQRYDPDPRGHLAAREAVAAYYASDGLAVSPDRIVLTSGTSESYGFLFKLLCNAGDRVLVPRPSYPLLEHLAALDGVDVAPYTSAWTPTRGWRLEVDSLARALTPRTRGVVAVHPNNPTGAYHSPEEIEALGSFCARHGLALIADEVFFDYPSATGAPDRRRMDGAGGALTFSLSGLSKVAALPQLKLGWILVGGPPEAAGEALARLEFIADAYLTVGAPVQLAAKPLLDLRNEAQSRIRERIRRNESLVIAWSGDRTRLSPRAREGGWNVILEPPPDASDEALAVLLLESEGVLVHPGYFYDFEEDHLLVASLIVAEETFRAGWERLAARIAPPLSGSGLPG